MEKKEVKQGERIPRSWHPMKPVALLILWLYSPNLFYISKGSTLWKAFCSFSGGQD